ncbi:hypothetical protein ABT299_52125, partial [Spirillospora sp. NPDC000708]
MSTHGRAAEVERTLRTAPAHALPETLAALLQRELPRIRGARLLVNDYHSRILLPVEPFPTAPGGAGGGGGGAPGRVERSGAGRPVVWPRPRGVARPPP